jgi:hypothetical protein
MRDFIPRIGLLVALLFAIGCTSPAVKEMEALAEKACACPDIQCAGNLLQEFAVWRERAKNMRGSERDKRKFDSAYKEFSDCMSKQHIDINKLPALPATEGDKASEPPAEGDKAPEPPAEGSQE